MSDSAYKQAYAREKAARLAAEKLSEDLTRRVYDQNKLLEEVNADLRRNQQTIVQQEKMASIGMLASGIAHEINNPLGFSLSNLGVLLEYIESIDHFFAAVKKHDALPDDLRELLQNEDLVYALEDMPALVKESVSGLDSVKEIVTDLRGFARSNEGAMSPADINEGLRTTISVLRNELKYGVLTEVKFNPLPLVNCNIGKMNQVFANVIGNAAQAMEEGGTLYVITEALKDQVKITISDDGPGISEEHLDHLFDAFFTTKPVGQGTGLGLAISYAIITDEHHGSIKASNDGPGKGATFTILLPVGKN